MDTTIMSNHETSIGVPLAPKCISKAKNIALIRNYMEPELKHNFNFFKNNMQCSEHVQLETFPALIFQMQLKNTYSKHKHKQH